MVNVFPNPLKMNSGLPPKPAPPSKTIYIVGAVITFLLIGIWIGLVFYMKSKKTFLFTDYKPPALTGMVRPGGGLLSEEDLIKFRARAKGALAARRLQSRGALVGAPVVALTI